jgi:hypothetical protein
MDMRDFQQDAQESFAAETPKNIGWDFNRANARFSWESRSRFSAPLRFLYS